MLNVPTTTRCAMVAMEPGASDPAPAPPPAPALQHAPDFVSCAMASGYPTTAEVQPALLCEASCHAESSSCRIISRDKHDHRQLQLLVALARVVGNVLAHKASWTAPLCVTWGRRVWQKAWRRLATGPHCPRRSTFASARIATRCLSMTPSTSAFAACAWWSEVTHASPPVFVRRQSCYSG